MDHHPLADALNPILAATVPALCPALQLTVRHRGRTVLSSARGWLDPAPRAAPVDTSTRFDVASLTKLFTVTACMRLVEAGRIQLDEPVNRALPEWTGTRPVAPYEDPLQSARLIPVPTAAQTVDTGKVTLRHLLTHTAGLPPWRPLFTTESAHAARTMALTTPFACAPGEHILYSDIGLILLGLAVEELTGQPLDEAIDNLVIRPLGLKHSGFLPTDRAHDASCAPTEFCGWRGVRVRGAVHDENAYRLGGVAGHAGIFATAEDTARFGQGFLEPSQGLLAAETVAAMTAPQATEGDLTRGLGFVLWSPDPAAVSHTFSTRAYGHTGFTGTSLWIDPAQELVVALLTNEVFNGRSDRRIAQIRAQVHGAIVAAVDAWGEPPGAVQP